MDKSSSRYVHTCMSVLSHLSFIQQILTEVLLCATNCSAGHPGCARHPVPILQLFPLPSPALNLATTTQKGKVPWTAQCTCQREEPSRKAEIQPPPLFMGTFSFPLGESRGNLVSYCFSHTFKSIYTPIHLPYSIQKLRKNICVFQGCWEISHTHSPLLLHLLFLVILSHVTLNSCSTTQTLFLSLYFWTFSLFWVFLVHHSTM